MGSSLSNASGFEQVINESSTKIITKMVFTIHENIEDFIITARNQLITIGSKSLRMCRIPDEVGKVKSSVYTFVGKRLFLPE